MEDLLGSSLKQMQGWTTVRQSYSRALEQGPLLCGRQVVERMLDVYNGSAFGVKECCNDDDDDDDGNDGSKDDEGFTTPTSRGGRVTLVVISIEEQIRGGTIPIHKNRNAGSLVYFGGIGTGVGIKGIEKESFTIPNSSFHIQAEEFAIHDS